MATIQDLRKKYHPLIAPLDLELLFSFILKTSRESVLTHPENKLKPSQLSTLDSFVLRRAKGEPIAYLLGKKEFYRLEFEVNKNTLVPRPETELMVDLALEEVRTHVRTRVRNINIVDIGTGSGNIIISLAHNLKNETSADIVKFHGIDISSKAIAIAKQNAKTHKLTKKIKLLHGNLLEPFLNNFQFSSLESHIIILANLPYLSSKIYSATPVDVKLYEPKTALYSPQNGLAHYIKLLKQLSEITKKCSTLHASCYMEISPEQKPLLTQIIKKTLPRAQTTCHKDLSGRWRICKIEI